MKARTQILDEIKKNNYLVDAKVDVDKDGMKLLIKKVHEKDIPIVLKEKQRKLGMSSAISEDTGNETALTAEN